MFGFFRILGLHWNIYYIVAFCDLERTVQYEQKAWMQYDKKSVFSIFDVTVENPIGAAILK